jgi:hypothetical protein
MIGRVKIDKVVISMVENPAQNCLYGIGITGSNAQPLPFIDVVERHVDKKVTLSCA